MEILGVGPAEMLVIVVIALIVFGPGKLPELGAAVGRTIGELRRATRDLTSDLQGSLNEVRSGIEDTVNEATAQIKDASQALQHEAQALSAEISAPFTATIQPVQQTAQNGMDEAERNWLKLGFASEDGAGTG